ncbi:hypothetical protein QCI47_16200 [Bacillus cereus group sp. RP29]|uniref:hypothetical protein n=1 Tax=Bacillus cereus group sp. RP29 TaxID=3040257 RepID=UPI0033972F41
MVTGRKGSCGERGSVGETGSTGVVTRTTYIGSVGRAGSVGVNTLKLNSCRGGIVNVTGPRNGVTPSGSQ